ncbi:TPA: hypothetical protein QDB06_000810 [Burkholderia vietnamiensis]|nr:hypothetical protein [Burkholderia vietnamiensis]
MKHIVNQHQINNMNTEKVKPNLETENAIFECIKIDNLSSFQDILNSNPNLDLHFKYDSILSRAIYWGAWEILKYLLSVHHIAISERVLSAFKLSSTKGRQFISSYEKDKIRSNLKTFNSLTLKLHLSEALPEKKTKREKRKKI